MDTKPRLKISLFPVVLSVVLFSMLFSISTLNTGRGFGREVNLVTNDIRDKYDFSIFAKELKENNIEFNVYDLNSERLLIKFTGIGDVKTFTKTLNIKFPEILIYETGTFGSISGITKTMKTLQSYFIVFILSFVSVWTYRYRLLGLIYGLSISTMIVGSIFVSNRIGFVFNTQTWFTTLVVFTVLTCLKSWTIHNINNEFEIDKIIEHHTMSGVILFGTASFLMMLDSVFASSATIFVFTSIMLMGESYFLKNRLIHLKRNKEFDPLVASLYEKREGINVPEIINSKFIVLFVASLILFVSVLSAVNPERVSAHSRDFSNENYLIVDNNDASGFLEVQATLGRLNLSSNLIEYKISEEKKTWFLFNETTDWQALESAKEAIENKLDVATSIFLKQNFDYTLEPNTQLLLLVIFNIFVGMMMWFLLGRGHAIIYGIFAGLMFGFVSVYMMVFNFPNSLEYTILKVSLPVIVSVLLLFFKDKAYELDSKDIGGTLGFVASILALLILPIVLIIPDPNPAHYLMISLMIVASLSFLSTMIILYYLIALKEKVQNVKF